MSARMTEDEYLHTRFCQMIGALPVLPPRGIDDGFDLFDLIKVKGTNRTNSRFEMMAPLENNLADFLEPDDKRRLREATIPETERFTNNEGQSSLGSIAWTTRLAGMLGLAPGLFFLPVGFAALLGAFFDRSRQVQVYLDLQNATFKRLSSAREHYGGMLVEKLIYKYLQNGRLLSSDFRVSIHQHGNPRFVFGVVREAYLGNLFVRAGHGVQTNLGINGKVPVPVGAGPATVTSSVEAKHTTDEAGMSQIRGRGIVGVKLSCFKVKTTHLTNPEERVVRVSEPIDVISGDDTVLTEARLWASRYGGVVQRMFRRLSCRRRRFTGVLVLIVRDSATWLEHKERFWFGDGDDDKVNTDEAEEVDHMFHDAFAYLRDEQAPANSSTSAPTEIEDQPRLIRDEDLFAPLLQNQGQQAQLVAGWSVIDTVIFIEAQPNNPSTDGNLIRRILIAADPAVLHEEKLDEVIEWNDPNDKCPTEPEAAKQSPVGKSLSFYDRRRKRGDDFSLERKRPLLIAVRGILMAGLAILAHAKLHHDD